MLDGKESAILSKELGTINTKSPLEVEIEDLKREEWDKEKVFEIFTKLRFNKYIDRFSLRNEEREINPFDEIEIKSNLNDEDIEKLISEINKNKRMVYYLNTKEDSNEGSIIKRKICSISIIIKNKVYYIEDINTIENKFKDIFENKEIAKIGDKLKQDYILLKQKGIELDGFKYDTEIAGYILDSTKNKYDIETLALRYLNLEVSRFIKKEEKQEQLDLFSMTEENNSAEKEKSVLYAYCINKLYEVTMKLIEEQGELDLFENIEMPTSRVLAKMQYNGIYVDKEELIEYGRKLKIEIEEKTQKIYNLCGQEFNINSTKQLGKILFEDLKLPVQKKKKSGYSTDVEVLEKLREEHPVINEILDYRQLMKLNSTYVEGMMPYINSSTNRIHSFFHQTVTATRKNK